jgi:intergrase/recombinase
MKDFGTFKKITTEDCINAICKLLYFQGKRGDSLNPKNWKRRSKSGSNVIIRTFENVATREKYIVSETNNQIFKIEDNSGVSDVVKPTEDSILKGLELLYINNDITNDGMALCVLSIARNGKIVSLLDKKDIRELINLDEEEDFGASWANLDFACGSDNNAKIEQKIERIFMDMGLGGDMEGIFSADEDEIEDIISKLESMGVVVYRNKYNKKREIN